MSEDNKVIQSLWIGSSLSAMEKLCINSFLQNGHEFHLYTYDQIEGVPSKVVLKDAREILSSNMIFTYQSGHGKGSLGAFSDLFRFKLLFDKGGWWVDTDQLCLKPFDINSDYVFSSERRNLSKHQIVNAGVIKAPSKSLFAKYCLDKALAVDKKKVQWGDIGPSLVNESINKNGLSTYIKSHLAFCPIHYSSWRKIIESGQLSFTAETYGIHLWNEMWRRAGKDKNGKYGSNTLYERLKREYL